MSTFIVFECERCGVRSERRYDGATSMPAEWGRVTVRHRTGGGVTLTLEKVVCPACRTTVASIVEGAP